MWGYIILGKRTGAEDQRNGDQFIYDLECASVDRKRCSNYSQKRLHVDLIHAQKSADLGIEACGAPRYTHPASRASFYKS